MDFSPLPPQAKRTIDSVNIDTAFHFFIAFVPVIFFISED